MSFFYDLNKKLDGIRATPEVTHQQLNERSMSRAAKGIEKYTKPGMEELSRLGREGASEKKMDAARAKYNQYDNTEVDEGKMWDKFVNSNIGTKIGDKVEKLLAPKPGGSTGSPSTPSTAGHSFGKGQVTPGGPMGQFARYNNMNKNEGAHSQDAMELNPDFDKIGRKPGVMDRVARGAKKVADVIAPGDDELLDRLEKSSGAAPRQPGAKEPRYMEAMSPAKQKSFAALAPPKDKITFADKIAGAKKEVDEMLGDVAAEAMKKALGGGRSRGQGMEEAAGSIDYDKVLDAIAALYGDDIWENDAMQDLANDLEQAGPTDRELDFIIAKGKLPKRLAGIQFSAGDSVQFGEASDDNAFTAHKRARVDTPKVGTITHGSKHDVEEIPGGRRVTRRTDAQGISVGADDDKPADGEKRSRGRPKGPEKAPERVTGGATKHKGGRKTNEGSDYGQAQQIYDDLADVRAVAKQAQRGGEFPQGFASRLESVLYAAMTLIKNQQAGGAQVSEEELDEKAVSKKQQKFMGMVHAAQKGEKPASGAVAKTAKTMGKKDAEDFASTKHKGLPEKKKPEDKDKKKEVEETSDNTPGKSSGGFKFGGGIYDSINRDLENMIAESMSRLDESMSINMSMNNDEHGGPTRSLTVTATDDDAAKLAQLLKSAGLGGGDDSYGSEQHMHEVSMNQPDYPTNTETSNDALQYSGGLNKPKSTGQATVPVLASQQTRQVSLENQTMPEAGSIDRQELMAILKRFDEDMMEIGGYGDPDYDKILAALNQGDVESAVQEVYGNYGDQDGGEIRSRDFDAYIEGLEDQFKDLAGVASGSQDDLSRMMEMAGMGQTQIDEGMMDKLKSLVVPKLMKLLGPDAVDIANAVKQATGGDLSPTKENAMRVIQALGINKAAEQGQSPQMAEGIAGNWQGKLRQALYTVGLLGSTGAFAAMTGTPALIMGVIGVALLMMANAVFGSGPGSVGVMGKFGNKGTSTQRGLDVDGSPITNTNVDESDDLSRMMEMAGVKKKAVDEEKTEEGNLFTKGLADDNVKVGDKIPGTNAVKKKDIDESIFAMTANLWKTYKG